MKRSKLYELVWSKPMTKLAAELGISDVGLSKVCRRHDIPVPIRGHWAKQQAGKSTSPTPLPNPDRDPEVTFASVEPTLRTAMKAARRLERESIAAKTREVESADPGGRQKYERRHPLVKATADYVSKIPAMEKRVARMTPLESLRSNQPRPPQTDNGRWLLDVPNGLSLTASREAMPWVLEFHDRMFKAFVQAGGRVYRKPGKDRGQGSIVAELQGETIALSFRQGYRKRVWDADEFEKLRKKNSWASAWAFVPSDTFTFLITGTERSVSRQWAGNAEMLDAKLPEIVATTLHLLEQQPEIRQARLTEEARRQEEAEKAERMRRAQSARREQLELAFKASEAYDRTKRLMRFLSVVERECGSYNEPYGERAKVWLGVVREQLKASEPHMEILSECLSKPHWKPWPPDWWPAAFDDGETGSDELV